MRPAVPEYPSVRSVAPVQAMVPVVGLSMYMKYDNLQLLNVVVIAGADLGVELLLVNMFDLML